MKLFKSVIVLLCCMPLLTKAGWQVVDYKKVSGGSPFFQDGKHKKCPKKGAGNGKTYVISINGSLKNNLERIMTSYHWKVKWLCDKDYNFDGRVSGTDLPTVIQKLIKHFPLRATFYEGNKVMTVSSRPVDSMMGNQEKCNEDVDSVYC